MSEHIRTNGGNPELWMDERNLTSVERNALLVAAPAPRDAEKWRTPFATSDDELDACARIVLAVQASGKEAVHEDMQRLLATLAAARAETEQLRAIEAIVTVEKHAKDGGFAESGLLAVGQSLISRAKRIEELQATVARLTSEHAALLDAGNLLANAAYNLAQREHLWPDERATLDKCRKQWDAARTARASSPATTEQP